MRNTANRKQKTEGENASASGATASCFLLPASSARGFTLLIAVVLASVALAVGLALLGLAYKQVLLASSARQSQTAFYNADTALECALYYDQQHNAFGYGATGASITCNGATVNASFNQSAAPRVRAFVLPCPGGGAYASTTIYKASSGATAIFSSGYSSCGASDPRRVERGLKVTY